MTCFCWGNDSFDSEKADLLQLKDYLVEKIVVAHRQPLCEMPSGIGLQFQGEWALYSCSMLASELSNMVEQYPEIEDEAIVTIDSLIQIVKSPELRLYDKITHWNSLIVNSPVSYLNHLAWIIGNYRRIGSGDKYNQLHDSLCIAMNSRIVSSELLNLPTYPDESVYVPDMLVAIVALSNYAKFNNGKYSDTVSK